MKIFDLLKLDLNKKHIISIVGAGGKSTTMERLARELKEIGKKVLVTTTTKVLTRQLNYCDIHFLETIPLDYIPGDGTITGFGEKIIKEKISGGKSQILKEIFERNIFDIILIEADGAKNKAIKANSQHEPVVPFFTTITLGIIGLDAVGKPLNEKYVHRSDIFSEILNIEKEKILDEKDIVKLILKKEGLFKNSVGRKILFLNKGDTEKRINRGIKIKELLEEEGFRQVYITKVKI